MSSEYIEGLNKRRKKTTSAVSVKRALTLSGGAEDMNQFDEDFEEIKVDLKNKLGRNPSNLETMVFLIKLYKEEKNKSEAVQVKEEPDFYSIS